MRVAVADDTVLFRDGLVLILQKMGAQVTAAAASGGELQALIRREVPDIVVIDIMMNGQHEGIPTAVEIRRVHPQVGILLLSGYANVAYAQEIGGQLQSHYGYLHKDHVATVGALAEALDRIAAGEVVIDPGIVADLLKRPANRSVVDTLTRQERQVLEGMAEGRSNSGIARQLNISSRTVEAHVTRIFSHLGLHESDDGNRRVQAVIAFLRSRQRA